MAQKGERLEKELAKKGEELRNAQLKLAKAASEVNQSKTELSVVETIRSDYKCLEAEVVILKLEEGKAKEEKEKVEEEKKLAIGQNTELLERLGATEEKLKKTEEELTAGRCSSPNETEIISLYEKTHDFRLKVLTEAMGFFYTVRVQSLKEAHGRGLLPPDVELLADIATAPQFSKYARLAHSLIPFNVTELKQLDAQDRDELLAEWVRPEVVEPNVISIIARKAEEAENEEDDEEGDGEEVGQDEPEKGCGEAEHDRAANDKA